MKRPPAIVWDWDNTLVDGWPAILAGLNAALRDAGQPEWTLDEVRSRVRHSLRDTFPGMFGDAWERARDIFYAGVRAEHLRVLRPMPGAEAMLLRTAAVAPLAVLSNKSGPLLRREAHHLGWTSLFRGLVGAGDAAADKPDPRPMRIALAACGVPAGEGAWYVGDTALDMQAARAAGMTAVLLGDAAHDGGVQAASPALHFPHADALAEALALAPPEA